MVFILPVRRRPDPYQLSSVVNVTRDSNLLRIHQNDSNSQIYRTSQRLQNLLLDHESQHHEGKIIPFPAPRRDPRTVKLPKYGPSFSDISERIAMGYDRKHGTAHSELYKFLAKENYENVETVVLPELDITEPSLEQETIDTSLTEEPKTNHYAKHSILPVIDVPFAEKLDISQYVDHRVKQTATKERFEHILYSLGIEEPFSYTAHKPSEVIHGVNYNGHCLDYRIQEDGNVQFVMWSRVKKSSGPVLPFRKPKEKEERPVNHRMLDNWIAERQGVVDLYTCKYSSQIMDEDNYGDASYAIGRCLEILEELKSYPDAEVVASLKDDFERNGKLFEGRVIENRNEHFLYPPREQPNYKREAPVKKSKKKKKR